MFSLLFSNNISFLKFSFFFGGYCMDSFFSINNPLSKGFCMVSQ